MHSAHTARMIHHIRRLGFSMIEMSIVLVIMGVILTSGLLASAQYMQYQANIDTENQIDEIFEAIKIFHRSQGRLPCPAQADVALGDAGFATEILLGVCDMNDPAVIPAGTTRISDSGATASHPSAVRIGALPTRPLGLPDAYIADAFGNRYIYAVTEALTSTNKFAEKVGLGNTATDVYAGAISVFGKSAIADTEATGVAFIVIAMGENGRSTGAYRYVTGNIAGTCVGALGLDAENCDYNDAIFLETLFNNGDIEANYYDDHVRYLTKDLMLAQGTGNIADECAMGSKGIIRYNPTSGAREYCDGFDWQALPSTIGNAGNPCLGLEEGMVRLNPANTNQLQECDGNVWINF